MHEFPVPPGLDLWGIGLLIASWLGLSGVLTAICTSGVTEPHLLRFRRRVYGTVWLVLSGTAHAPFVIRAISNRWYPFGGDEFQLIAALWIVAILLVVAMRSRLLRAPGDSFASVCVKGTCCLTLLLIIGAMVMPTISSREVPLRMISKNNLKHVALGLSNFLDEKRTLEPSIRQNQQDISWRVALLPFLEERSAFSEYNSEIPWRDGGNTTTANRSIGAYTSVARERWDSERAKGRTSIGLIVGPGTAFAKGGIHRFGGTTIIAGECEGLHLLWAEPRDPDTSVQKIGINFPSETCGYSDGILSSYWPNGAFVLQADGSVRFLDKETDPAVLRRMLNPAP